MERINFSIKLVFQFLTPYFSSVGCPNNQNGITGGNGLIQHQVSVSGNTSSHQNMAINGMSSGHSSNTGIIQGAPGGNISNGGFGSNSSGPNYSSTSNYIL